MPFLDRYFDEGERRWTMLGFGFTNFHRTLTTYMQAFRDAGFTLDTIVDPTVNAENLRRYPDLDDELRVPNSGVGEQRNVMRSSALRS